MNYLEEFKYRLKDKSFLELMQLWEEYCSCDGIDAAELKTILSMIKKSSMKDQFGKYSHSIVNLWKNITEDKDSSDVLKLILDIDSSNDQQIADLAMEFLTSKYSTEESFSYNMKLVGLTPQKNFNGAIRNYELLRHMAKGRFVYHNAGWGTGEITDVSIIREQVTIEFENVSDIKDISFSNAFRTLVALKDDHFLAQRFGNPDEFEQASKKDPANTVFILLRDIGPKTASEIKTELFDLVISKDSWSYWWQSARTKLKRDERIDYPQNPSGKFKISKDVQQSKGSLSDVISGLSYEKTISAITSFMKEFPEKLSDKNVNNDIASHLTNMIDSQDYNPVQKLELTVIKSEITKSPLGEDIKPLIQSVEINNALKTIKSQSVKKKILNFIMENDSDWKNIFADLFLSTTNNNQREHIFKCLQSKEQEHIVHESISKMLTSPTSYPDALVWSFQKISSDPPVINIDTPTKSKLLEAILTLLYNIEKNNDKDACRKIHSILTSNKYSLIIRTIKNFDVQSLKEFLILISKCESFSSHDIHIMQSLAEVVAPELKNNKKPSVYDQVEDIIWTSREGLESARAKINKLYSDIVKSASEIEDARALGDLKENSEFKFAVERRGQIQEELKFILDQIKKARVIEPNDVSKNNVSPGSCVTLEFNNTKTSYTILGPWDADFDKKIISHKSKLAQKMIGTSIGDAIDINGEIHTVTNIEVCRQVS